MTETVNHPAHYGGDTIYESPYETLGVPVTADLATIKRAYRRRAGETHPDRDGSAEQFGRVNGAYLLLSDPDRRKRFDETGATDDEAQLLPMIVAAFDAVMAEAAQRGIDLVRHDVLGAMRNALQHRRHAIACQIREIELAKAAMERLLGRFERVDQGKNALDAVVQARCADLGRRHDAASQDMARHDAALAVLRQYQFLADAGQPLMTWGSGGSIWFTTSC